MTPNNTLGRYQIIREIARSNDIVYEAMDPQMNRRIALKELMLPHHLAGAQKRERIERFYREAKAAGTLSHPNIVTVYEVGQENDRHFIAMEFLEGQSLRDILQMQGALPLRETLDIVLQLCDALAYAHGHGVVHRDIKPDNVHILPGGVIKLTDFGIARITAEPSITSQGQVFGTPSYMSPEQVASQNVDHRTDLFSLGVTLYEMLTGRKPFTGDSVITITYNIMNLQPTMPVGIPPMLQGILQKALAKDPNLRYQNAAALAADLRAQKYELDSPAYQKTGSMTFGQMAPAASGPTPSLSGGSPSYLPGQPPPSGLSQMPGQPTLMPSMYPTSGASYPAYDRRGGLSSPARSFLGLLAAILAVVALLALLIWGVRAALHASQTDARQRAAYQMERAAQTAASRGDLNAAAQDYQSAQRLAPPGSTAAQQATQGLSNVSVAQGQQYQKSNDMNDAQAAYQQAATLDARNANAYYAQANLQQQQGDLPDAAQSFAQAAQANPTSPVAAAARANAVQIYQSLAQQAQSRGDINTARDDWQQIMTIDPGSAAATQAQAQLNSTTTTTAPPAGNSGL